MVNFSDVFPGEFLGYVTKYSERIQNILNEYEIVFFMARKAICFFEAMRYNGLLNIPSSCQVFSSRIVDYNVLDGFYGKRIAVIDDVVVKGESLHQILSVLNEHGLFADILVFARDINNNLQKSLLHFENYPFFSYIGLEQEDIYAFAGMITEYIEASMCPFNIDQPIYTITTRSAKLEEFLYLCNSIDLSSDIQRKYGISSHVIYFNILEDMCVDYPLSMLKNCIMKIRITFNGNDVIAFPFVLLPALTREELEDIFSLIDTKIINDFINIPSNPRIVQENKMKIASYFLSGVLAQSIFSMHGISFSKAGMNDIFQFPNNIQVIFEKEIERFCLRSQYILQVIFPIYIDVSAFTLPNVLASAYKAISDVDPAKQEYTNYRGKKITKNILITHEMLQQSLKKQNQSAKYLASCVIDIFIDRGMIVPSIVHTPNDEVIRAYKMGEYSKLTRSQIELFAAMLYEYQEMTDDSLQKTELEKLCVLFFEKYIIRRFKQQEFYEDGCYGISYSFYGPRVSASALSYQVDSKTALITDFCSREQDNKALVLQQNGKYIIQPISSRHEFTTAFAYQYSTLKHFFNSYEDGSSCATTQKPLLNQYVHTFIQYITLRAIGNNKKNQYLSLCAELFNVLSLPDNFFNLNKSQLDLSRKILSGVDSGLWKYWCYKGNALDKSTKRIFEKNKDVGVLFLMEEEPASDKSQAWDIVIDEAGGLLYKITYFIKSVLKEKNRSKEIQFTTGSYYANGHSLKELRHMTEEKVHRQYQRLSVSSFDKWCASELQRLKSEAAKQIEKCDVILLENNASIECYNKLIILYSEKASFFLIPPDISFMQRELFLDGIICKSQIKILGLHQDEDPISLLPEILVLSEETRYKYIVLDIDNPYMVAFRRIRTKKSKGAKLVEFINDKIVQLQQGDAEIDLVVVKKQESNMKDISGFAPIPRPTGETSIYIGNVTINNYYYTSNEFNLSRAQFERELEKLKQVTDDHNKKRLMDEALDAVKTGNEGKFKCALKKAGSFIIENAASFAVNFVIEYMKKNQLGGL